MIPEETVGNPELESEYFAAKILSGIIYPSEYTELRINMAGLPIPDVAGDLPQNVIELQDEVLSKFGTLDGKILQKYYYGDAPEVRALVEKIASELPTQIELYGRAVEEKVGEVTNRMESAASSMDYFDMGQVINQVQLPNTEIQQMDQTQYQLRKMVGVTRSILESYGLGSRKLPKKGIPVGLTTEYKIFLQELSNNVPEVTGNVKLAMTLGKALDSIFNLIPKDNLDPYVTDVCDNFLEVVTNPQSFYSLCERNEIVSSSIGQLFAHVYPEYYNKYQDMYMDDFESMDYQKQIDFRKCFGLDSDNSAISSLCSKYVKLGFQSPS